MTLQTLPEGALTFLLTDLVGSTRAWESAPEVMEEVMKRHDDILAAAVERCHGFTVEAGREGDSVLAVFRRAVDAAACALAAQDAFAVETWPGGAAICIRTALHTGEASLRDGHYYGQPLNRCARLLAAAHGGQVLVTGATAQLLVDGLPPGGDLMDLGHHRFKDLARPEHVYQLVDVRRPIEFPRIQSLLNGLTNLPVNLTEFVGREQELDQLGETLKSTRLLTLTGPGGVGKTRLSLQLAANAVHDYWDGVWLVELGLLTDPAVVPEAIAGALAVAEQAGRPVLDTVVERCRDRRMLLVLDNCEHVVDATAAVAERLLRNCDQVSVIATSRERLRISGEQAWPVRPLRRSEAVELFARSASRHSPSFSLSEANQAAVSRICERVDDLPLSIELAAARVEVLPVDQIVSRLGRPFTLLTGGSRTASARQLTLRGVVDWSHRLLTLPERTVFRRLATFAGRFSLDAAEDICGDQQAPREEVLDLLAHLVDKSLVVAGDGRYRMLETIRDYARERLRESGEADLLQRRLLGHLVAQAEARDPGRLAAWLDRLEELHDDLRSALRWCADADPELGMRLAREVSTFWQLRGHTTEARQLVHLLLDRAPEHAAARPAVLEMAGVFAYLHGDFAKAAGLLQRALAEARAMEDQATVLQALNRSGLLAVAQGELVSGESALREALALAQAAGDSQQEASCLHQLGLLVGTRGDLAGSRALLMRGIDLLTERGRRDEASISLTFAAFAMLLGGDLESARAYIRESLEIGSALKDHRAAWSLDVLACLTALDGRSERALRTAGAAHEMHESIGHHPSATWRALTSPMIEPARSALGPVAAEAAWAAGRRLGFEEALELAVAD